MEGNSQLAVTMLSPVFQLRPLATRLMPSLVLLTKVTSLGSALISRAALLRTSSACW